MYPIFYLKKIVFSYTVKGVKKCVGIVLIDIGARIVVAAPLDMIVMIIDVMIFYGLWYFFWWEIWIDAAIMYVDGAIDMIDIGVRNIRV